VFKVDFNFDARKFEKDMTKALVQKLTAHLRDVIGAMRHAKSGEFPTVVVLGEDLDDIRCMVEGSPELLEHVRTHLNDDDAQGVTFVPIRRPRVFLSYAFEDAAFAERIAAYLVERGIEVWWAGWEMRAGDSIRQRIDEGLAGCTHFVVLLTPTSLAKPWVNQEMDAGLVRKIEADARFIAARKDLPYDALPPLLSGLLSPDLSADPDGALRQLANDILGVTKKPALPAPAFEPPATGYSRAATLVAREFVINSESALFGDPQIMVDELARRTELSADDIRDAVSTMPISRTASPNLLNGRTGRHDGPMRRRLFWSIAASSSTQPVPRTRGR
jgi:hypothetical protein